MARRLRIAFYSYAFAPQVGGIETVSLMLATEFVRAGHEVRVLTATTSDAAEDFPFAVLRRPSAGELAACVQWSDVFFQNNISLPALWPLLFWRTPWVVAHHTWIRSVTGRIDLAAKLKLAAIRRASASISVSQAMADQFDTPQEIIGNAYEAALFKKNGDVKRERDLIFVGRLVSDKGVEDLLDALGLLRQKNLFPSLTIVGSGPEEAFLRKKTGALGLSEAVKFVGTLRGEELVKTLHQHRTLVVPSRWEEPYGLVALEGLACGCRVIGSEKGGLREAMGPGGISFPNGDVSALAAVLERVLRSSPTWDEAAIATHLAARTPRAVAEAYLEVLLRVARSA